MVHESVRIIDYVAIGLISLAMGLVLCLPNVLVNRGDGMSEAGMFVSPTALAANLDEAASHAPSGESADARKSSGIVTGSVASGNFAHESDKGAILPDLYDISGGAAAVVNGVEIGESAVRWVEDAFGQGAQGNAVGPEALRSAAVDYLTGLEVLRQEAASRGLSVGEDDVRRELADIRASFASEEDYSQYLRDRGVTEEALALGVESELLSAGLMAQVVPEADVQVSDSAVLDYLKPEWRESVARTDDGGDALERAAAAELGKLEQSEVADARAALRQQERVRLFMEWRRALEAAAEIG